MRHNILHYHGELQKYIHAVEKDETNGEALEAVKKMFLLVFEDIKMLMIAKQERYYGIFLMNFELVIDFSAYFDAAVSVDAVPFRMTVNPLLIGLKPLPEMIYIFCHEIEHIILNHPTCAIKYNPQKDPMEGLKLNLAMDAAVNDRLTFDMRTKGFNIIAEPKDAVTSAYLREDFKLHIKALQDFEYYFKRLPAMGEGGKAPLKIIFAGSTRRKEIVTEAKRKGTVFLPSWTATGDWDGCDGLIRRFIQGVWKDMPDAMRGSLPDHQKDALLKLMAPPSIPWKRLLKRYIGTIPAGRRKTRLRLSRRQPERSDISGDISDRIIKILVAIDTSGSMTAEELEHIMVEIFNIIGSRRCEVTVMECDAEIRRIYKVRNTGDISYEVNGRGGTSFVPVIEYVNANRYFRDAILIYFTDGMGDRSIPRPLTLRTMWVLYDKACKLSVQNPYGEVVYMEK